MTGSYMVLNNVSYSVYTLRKLQMKQ